MGQRRYKWDKWCRLMGSRVPNGAWVTVIRFMVRRRVLIEYEGQRMNTMLWCLEKSAAKGAA